MPQAYFTHEVHFTNPEGIYLVKKSTCTVKCFFAKNRNLGRARLRGSISSGGAVLDLRVALRRHSAASRKLSLQFCANGKLLRKIEDFILQKDWVEVFVLQSVKL